MASPSAVVNALGVDACMALVLRDDSAARAPLEQAWAAAERSGDAAAQYVLAAVALLAVNVEFADFRGLSRWIARFQAGAAAAPALSREVDALRVDAASTLLPSLDHAFAHDGPAARQAAERLFEALRLGRWPGGDEHLLLAKTLYDHYGMQNDAQRGERVAAFVAGELQRGEASAQWQGRWWLVLEAALDYWGQHAAAAEARRCVAALVGGAPQVPLLHSLAYGLAAQEFRQALREHDVVAQERLYDEIDRLRVHLRPGLVPRGLYWQAVMLLRRERFQAALERIDLVLALCADVEVPERDQGLYREQRAYALAGLHRWDEALQEIALLRRHQNSSQGEMADAIALALRAAAAIDRREPDARAHALAAVSRAAALQWRRMLTVFPRHAARLAEIALDAGLETEFVNALIRERRLMPSDRHRARWPWRLRVHALGALRIERDGELLQASGKAQRKPLELLRLLTACGGGPVDADAVIDELWPSLEANAPKASLEMALSRLRKLLGVPEAVVVTDGTIALAAELVWTDVAAFEARCDAAEAGDAAAAEEALALGRDKLLGNEELHGLARERRQRLVERATRLALEHGARLEAQGHADAAQRLYERGIAQEPLSERLYRALMRAQMRCGERAEALRTFRRCRDRLAEVLGTQPAPETLALAEQAREASS